MPTKMVSIRIDEDLLKYLTDRAEREHRSLSNMIISILLEEMKMRTGRIDGPFADFCFSHTCNLSHKNRPDYCPIADCVRDESGEICEAKCKKMFLSIMQR